MAIITLPTGMLFGAGTGVTQRTYDVVSTSQASGAVQARTFGPPRWALNLVAPEVQRPSEAALWESVLVRLRGRVNTLAAPDPGKLQPRGTRRGVLALGAAAAAGATTLNITGTGTLLTGDWLQIGAGLGSSQLVKVMSDASGSAVQIEPPLRQAFAISTQVTWDKPLAYYRLNSEPSGWTYGAGALQRDFALDLLEVWS